MLLCWLFVVGLVEGGDGWDRWIACLPLDLLAKILQLSALVMMMVMMVRMYVRVMTMIEIKMMKMVMKYVF